MSKLSSSYAGRVIGAAVAGLVAAAGALVAGTGTAFALVPRPDPTGAGAVVPAQPLSDTSPSGPTWVLMAIIIAAIVVTLVLAGLHLARRRINLPRPRTTA